MPQDKEAFELSAVLSLAENVKRQEKELKELRKQLEEAKDDKELKELRRQLEDAGKAEKELDDLRQQLEAASKQEKETQKVKSQLEETNKAAAGKQEKEVAKLKSQLEDANKALKGLRDEKEELAQAREKDLNMGRGIVPELSEVEAMAKKARADVSQIKVSASDSSEVLALAVMGAMESIGQLGEALGRIEQKLHEIIEDLNGTAEKPTK